MATVPVALLAGGLATRLGPITRNIPKVMVPVAGRPFIDHQLALLRRNGVRRVVLCLGHLGEQVVAHVGAGEAHGLDVLYSFDGPRLLGTGGALRRSALLLGGVFWVVYGDAYLDFDYAAALSHFARHRALGLMTVFPNEDRWDRSNVVFRGGRLLCYDKRVRTPDMTHIDYGAALLRAPALDPIPPDQPSDLADLYSGLVARGQMIGYEVIERCRFYEIGSPQGLLDTSARLAG
jgi:NDP-sugar pyrophosphorylase family protein